jgi:hypothetical protein
MFSTPAWYHTIPGVVVPSGVEVQVLVGVGEQVPKAPPHQPVLVGDGEGVKV